MSASLLLYAEKRLFSLLSSRQNFLVCIPIFPIQLYMVPICSLFYLCSNQQTLQSVLSMLPPIDSVVCIINVPTNRLCSLYYLCYHQQTLQSVLSMFQPIDSLVCIIYATTNRLCTLYYLCSNQQTLYSMLPPKDSELCSLYYLSYHQQTLQSVLSMLPPIDSVVCIIYATTLQSVLSMLPPIDSVVCIIYATTNRLCSMYYLCSLPKDLVFMDTIYCICLFYYKIRDSQCKGTVFGEGGSLFLCPLNFLNCFK